MFGMGIPGPTRPPWYVKEVWPAVVGLIVVVVAGTGAILKEERAAKPDQSLVYMMVAGLAAGIFLGVIKIAQSVRKDAAADRLSVPWDLSACLLVIHRTLAARKGLPPGPTQPNWMRSTIHRVDGHELEQCIPYVGSDDGSGAGRRWPIQSGLIGKVARTGEVICFDRDDTATFEAWMAWLVKEYGMTKEEAEAKRRDRHSFLGVPIKRHGSDQVEGVAYFDAATPGFFDQVAVELILQGCSGLAAWLERRYLVYKE